MSQPTPETGVPECYRHAGRETWIRCQRCERPICPDCMRDAAVGFQCPSCVSQGARDTRSGLAPYGGKRSGNPALTSQVLIGMNAVVWLLIVATGWRDSPWIERLALIPRGMCLDATDESQWFPQADEAVCSAIPHGAWSSGVADGAWWQLITTAFTHIDVWHLGINMLALWFLGPPVEAIIGRFRFLALYVLSALAGSTVVYWFADPAQQTVGASGAIFGLMGALLVLVHKHGGDLRQVFMWIAINFVITFTIPGISWQGHLGGFLGGLAVIALVVYSPRPRRTAWQWAGVLAFVVVLAVLVAGRTLLLV